MSSVWKTISQNVKLASLPDVYLRLRSVLDDPDSNLADVTDVVASDPALAARLLRIVNSAYFGLDSEIDTISRAVGLLGTQEVHDLVLTASMAHYFEGMSNDVMSMDKFWRRSVESAITTRELAFLRDVLDSERLFVVGLLRDIGHLFIYQLAPHEAQQAIELSQRRNIPLHEAERSLLGADYAEVGADLMRRLQLPRSLWEPAEFQLAPEKSQEYGMFTSLVHITACLLGGVERGLTVDEALDEVSEHAWRVCGLTRKQCARISDRVDPQVAAVMRLIFPALNASAA